MDNYLEYAPCGYLRFNSSGQLILVNHTLVNWLEYENKIQLTGKSIEVIFTLATRIFYQTHFFPLLKMQGFAEEIFITLLTKNKKEVPVLVNVRSEEVNGEKEYTCICITVHNRKKFEEELIRARKAAETALNDNAALTQAKSALQQHTEELDTHIMTVKKQNRELRQFNRVVTHNLQEPLRKLNIFAGRLLEIATEQNMITAELEKIIRVAAQMRLVVSGLQEYVWLQETVLKISLVDLKALALQVQQQLSDEFGEDFMQIKFSDLPKIRADEAQMRLLFYQLFSNAILFRKENDTAQIKISGTLIQQNIFREVPERYHYGSFLKLEITDNGIGFDPEYREQIFELFKKLDAKGGKGIGLSLSRMVIENHSGQITADSKPGQGSTFTILLPMES